MKRLLESVRTTIADMSRPRRWLFAVCATVAHIVVVTLITSSQTPIPTLLAIVGYAMLVMYLTGTWRKAHVWAPSVLLLLCVYPFLATITVTIAELIATNIAMRSVRPNPEATADDDDPTPPKGNREQRRKKTRKKRRRHSQ